MVVLGLELTADLPRPSSAQEGAVPMNLGNAWHQLRGLVRAVPTANPAQLIPDAHGLEPPAT